MRNEVAAEVWFIHSYFDVMRPELKGYSVKSLPVLEPRVARFVISIPVILNMGLCSQTCAKTSACSH